jgi:hypothetical protein
VITGVARLWELVVLAALYGAFDAAFQPATGGLVPHVAGAERLQQANALPAGAAVRLRPRPGDREQPPRRRRQLGGDRRLLRRRHDRRQPARAAHRPAAVIAALELLASVAVAYGFTLWDTTLAREIPPQALARVTSLDWFTTVGSMPIGYALVGALAAAVGTRATMLAATLAVIALLAACLAAGDVRRYESIAS